MDRSHPRVGVLVPFDFALERELIDFAPDDVGIHFARIEVVEGSQSARVSSRAGSPKVVEPAAATLRWLVPDAAAYACTAASFVGGLPGERRTRDALALGAGVPADRAVTTSGALLEVLAAHGISRIAVGTPYVSEVAALLPRFLEEAGVEVVASANLELQGDELIWASPATVARLARAAAHPDAQAIFLSCTNLPTIAVVGDLAAEFGRPVLAANQVTMWAALRRLGRALARGHGGLTVPADAPSAIHG